MADEQTQTQTAGTNDANGGGGEAKITFTPEQQKVIDQLLGERAKRAESSGVNALLKELGVEKPDDLKSALDEFKKLKASQLSDLEKAQQAAKEAQAKIEAAEKARNDALAHAQTKLMRAAVIAEAVRQNFAEEEISSVWLALMQDKDLKEKIKASEDGENFEGVDKAVAEIAKNHPKWLKSENTRTNINAQERSNRDTSKDAAAREAELRARFRLNGNK